MNMMIRQTAIKQQRRMRGVKGLADPMRLSLQDKLLGTEYLQDAAELALEIVSTLDRDSMINRPAWRRPDKCSDGIAVYRYRLTS